MKRILLKPILLILSFIIFLLGECYSSEVELFINACRNQGLNPKLFYSGRIDFSLVIKEPPASEEKIIAEIETLKESHRQAAEKNPAIKIHLEKIFENIPQGVRNRFSEDKKMKGHIVFKKDSSLQDFAKFEICYFDLNSKKWSLPTIVLRLLGPNQKSENAIWNPDMQQTNLGNIPFGVDNFQVFGRITGGFIFESLSILCTDNIHEFSASNIESYKKKHEHFFRQVDLIQYDDDKASASVLEYSVNNNILYRYWIDASRGFICPLIQIYDPETGNIQEESISKNYFLHKKTGLWYPSYHEQTKFDTVKGGFTEKRIYTIDPNVFDCNCDIVIDEFAIDIPIGTKVVDNRDKKDEYFMADEVGILSLTSAGFDLKNQKWLRKIDANNIPQRASDHIIIRFVLIVSGIVLILWAIFRKIWKGGVPILLLVCFMNGCSHNISSNEIADAIPAILDFGQVRPTDSPIQLEFYLKNNSDKTLNILEISSGCGCTVIEPATKTILPKTKIHIPIKVNVWGRYGDFKNEVRIKIDHQTEPTKLVIQGKIISDIWFNGQSVRCTAVSDSFAKSVIELHTIDYPDITFDFSKIDKSMTIKELSRITNDRETTIKFALTVEMVNTEMSTHSLIFEPTNKIIAPIIIPVYCYSNKKDFDFPLSFKTQAIHLGIVQVNESPEVLVYGDPDLIGIIKEVSFHGSPEGVSLQLFPHQENDALCLVFQFSGDIKNTSIDGNVKFVTTGKRKIVLPISGQIGTENISIPITAAFE
jgi:hypothetical protein